MHCPVSRPEVLGKILRHINSLVNDIGIDFGIETLMIIKLTKLFTVAGFILNT